MPSKSSAPKGEGSAGAVKPPVAKNEGSGASAKTIKPTMSKVGGGGGGGGGAGYAKPPLPKGSGMGGKLATGLVLGVAGFFAYRYYCGHKKSGHKPIDKMVNHSVNKAVDLKDNTKDMAKDLKNISEDIAKKVKTDVKEAAHAIQTIAHEKK